MELVNLTEEEFQSYVETQKCNNFSQTMYVKKTREDDGNKVCLYGLKDNDKILAAGLFVKNNMPFGYCNYYCPCGFITDFNNKNILKVFSSKLKETFSGELCLFFRIDPYIIYKKYNKNEGNAVEENKNVISNLLESGYIHNGFTIGQGKDNRVRWQCVIDINNQSFDDIKSKYNTTTRRHINHALKYGVTVRKGDDRDIREFNKILEHTAQRKNFHQKSKKYFEAFYNNFKDKILFLIAEVDLNIYENLLNAELNDINLKLEKARSKGLDTQIKQFTNYKDTLTKRLNESKLLKEKYGDTAIVSASFFVLYNGEVNYFHGGGYEDLLDFHGQYLLQNEAIKYAVENNYKIYNFMGISGDLEHDGLYKFKSGFSGEAIELIGQFDYPVKKILYKTYMFIRKIKNILKK